MWIGQPGGISDSVASVRAMVDQTGCSAFLLVQSSAPASATFVHVPAVIVLDGVQDWDPNAVRISLTAAAGKLWTTSQLGARWVSGTAGRHPVERLDGLGALTFASSGRLLVLGNDARLLAAVLDRVGARPSTGALDYAAGFRHSLVRSDYLRVMTALDFGASHGKAEGDSPPDAPAFFSGNIGSLGRVLSSVAEVRVTEEERGAVVLQTVLYRMAP